MSRASQSIPSVISLSHCGLVQEPLDACSFTSCFQHWHSLAVVAVILACSLLLALQLGDVLTLLLSLGKGELCAPAVSVWWFIPNSHPVFGALLAGGM